ncbi:MAG: O-antigen ligase family protein, partial [Victivallales bacterium]|nr:O-antigen ligase family protein [Victivallales bacterium]
YRYYLCLLLVLMPLKFCTVMGDAEQPNFPLDIWQWLFFTCLPNYILVALCGTALLFAGLLYKMPRRWLPILPFLLFLLAGALSLFKSTELDYAINWLEHIAGATALCAAIWITLHNDDKLAPALVNVIGAMGLLCVLHGWYQHFIGLEENRKATMELAAQGVMKVSGTMAAKLEQTRIYGTFADPNVYAANLLFCLPFSLLLCNNAGRHFEKPRLGSAMAMSLAAVLYACALYWSGSRGAAVGAAAGIGIALCCLPKVRNSRLRLAMPLAALCLAALLVFAASLSKGRGDLKTASARMIYYKTAVRIFARQPLLGAGLGEYFPWYMRLKPAEAEVTRDPHNLPLSLLSQCGMPGGLAALAFYLLPWLFVFMREGRYSAKGKIALLSAIGVAAWSVHSLFQFNELIPGTFYLVAAGMAFIVPKGDCLPNRKAGYAGAALDILLMLAFLHSIEGYSLQRDCENPEKMFGHFASSRFNTTAPRIYFDGTFYTREWSDASYVKKWQLCLQAADLLVKRGPHRTGFHLRRAQALYALKKDAEARNALMKAIEWSPSNADAYLLLAAMNAMPSTQFTSEQVSQLLYAIKAADARYHVNENGPYIDVSTDSLQLRQFLDSVRFMELNGSIIYLKKI